MVYATDVPPVTFTLHIVYASLARDIKPPRKRASASQARALRILEAVLHSQPHPVLVLYLRDL